ncbi:MAG: minor extracellular serine protease Vpr [Chloroflexota bacterium]|jgi:subtilisin family serine protease|nr:minor extracellular serine protease Vpr [Chloroflexota bacterium]
MKRRHSTSVGVSLLVAAMLMPASVAAKSPTTRSTDGFGHPAGNASKIDISKIPSMAGGGQTKMVFVELSGRPVASYQAAELSTSANGSGMSDAAKASVRQRLVAQQRQVQTSIAATGARIQSSFTDVLNGFRAVATAKQLRTIARLPNVAAIYSVPKNVRSDVQSADYVGAIDTWTDSGFTGAGVKIAVIDSGINYYHRNFGGSGNPGWKNDKTFKVEPGTFPTAKVIDGYDFVGDNYDPDVPSKATPHPDPDPLDCKRPNSENVQHGSHVAGIAAGMGVLSNGTTYTGPYTASAVSSANFRIGPGIAPDAKLMAYRVLGCGGGTFVTLDAIEMAVRDGADVINMSLGLDFGNPESIDSIASNNAAEAGVTVVASAGNSGQSAYITGSPAAASRVISVGAMDAAQFLSSGAIVDFPGSAVDVGGHNMYDTALPVGGTMDVLVDGDDNLADGCEAADFAGVNNGDLVTIVRGACDFSAKRANAQAAGADGVVMVNNQPGTIVNPVPDPDSDIPMISVSTSREADLRAGDGLNATIHDGNVENDNLGEPASFTSAGPSRRNNILKPDVSAPGVDVVSTDGATVAMGKSLGGTSMASPQVAGAAALLLEAHSNWSPAHVKGALVGTASTNNIDPYSVRRSGSGVIDIPKAINTVSWAEASNTKGSSSITFGYEQLLNQGGSDVLSETQSFRLYNNANHSITYDLSNDFNTSAMGLSVSLPSSVTVPANSSRPVSVTVSLSEADAAALPALAPGDGPVLAVSGIELYLPLLHIAGTITADPTTTGTGHRTIGVPWILIPRGTSQIKNEQHTAYTSAGSMRQATVRVKNHGIHDGNVDVFAWGLEDTNEGQGDIDLRAAGVQSLPTEFCTGGDPDPTDRCLIFAVNTWNHWDNAAEAEFDVLIDNNNDGTADFLLAALDYQLIFGPGTADGVPTVVVIDLNAGAVVDFWFAAAPPNGSTYLMPVLASEIGRTAHHSKIRYWVESIPVYDDGGGPGNANFNFDQMLTGGHPGEAHQLAWYDTFNSPVSNGDFVNLNPGESADIPLTLDASRYQPRGKGMKGWLLVNMEDPNGAAQADMVPVGPLP